MPNGLGPGRFNASNATTTRPPWSPSGTAGAARDFFQNCTDSALEDGTSIPAEWLNLIKAQFESVISASGVTEDGSDDMTLRAIRRQRLNFVAAASVAGSANAITLAFSPTWGALADLVGTPLRFIVEAAPTGPVTVQVDGLSALPLVDAGGAQLGAGSLAVGQLVEIMCTGSAFVHMAGYRLPRAGGSTSLAPALAVFEGKQVVNVTAPTSTNVAIPYTQQRSTFVTSTWSGSAFTVGAGEGGVLDVDCGLVWYLPTNTFCSVLIRKNGAIWGELDATYSPAPPGGIFLQAKASIPVVPGDVITFAGYQQSGGTGSIFFDTVAERSRVFIKLISSL